MLTFYIHLVLGIFVAAAHWLCPADAPLVLFEVWYMSDGTGCLGTPWEEVRVGREAEIADIAVIGKPKLTADKRGWLLIRKLVWVLGDGVVPAQIHRCNG